MVNGLLGTDTMVEKKFYDSEEDYMMQQAVKTGAEMVVGENGGRIAGKIVEKVFSKAFDSKLVSLGRCVTGRNVPSGLSAQLAMDEILSNPQLGRSIIQNIMDPRWKGWSKMQYIDTSQTGKNIVIHSVGQFKNGKLVAVDDFNFK